VSIIINANELKFFRGTLFHLFTPTKTPISANLWSTTATHTHENSLFFLSSEMKRN